MMNWKIRHWMSVFINGYLRMAIFFFMTIQVSQSPKSMDFVLNLVAAVFIFEIDDYGTWGGDKPVVRVESSEEDCPASTTPTSSFEIIDPTSSDSDTECSSFCWISQDPSLSSDDDSDSGSGSDSEESDNDSEKLRSAL